MTKQEKQFYSNKSTIGYWSQYGGVEVKDIIYGIVDYVVVLANTMSEKTTTVHKLQVHIAPSGDEYIILNGHRFMFSDSIRC